ncbi:DUF4153 domain-containing protein [Tunicatimonas pelagia]|uniref:DUF4153 domain-containing protein n=1 Tax=Tunicatimonas pelagia TaxID=931531 RepID=UPI002666F941|nr:DUF4173 domain-containing protein [Tunicatimonas pelagia]WKN44771.1 DUF4173 domain-containing protein [Tunicatimonas pelagia]
MKNQTLKTYLWIGTSLLSSFLFYGQGAGLNFLLYSLVFVAISFVLYPELRQSASGWFITAGYLLTAVGVVWHHSWLAILLYLFSFIALAGFCAYPRTSLGIALPNGFYAAGLSFWRREWLNRKAKQQGSLTPARVMSWLVPVFITTLFLMLYIGGSPAFAALFTQTEIEVISFGRIVFTLVSAYLLLGIFYPTGIQSLIQLDQRIPNLLLRHRQAQKQRAFNTIGLKYEYRSGWLLFILLNGLLLLFNGVDTYHLWTGKLPQGVTYSEYVHQGVNALIISIILAISIVMYFFRGNLNFYHRSRRLKLVAYAWVAQNVFLVLATAYKNSLYIDAYGLTQKRIGVYVYLLMTLVGLFFTYVKVREIRTNAFLLRYTSWAFYAILAGLTLFNWPRFITKYNLTNLPAEQIDFQYLSYISDHNLDLLQDALVNPNYHIAASTRENIMNEISHFRYTESWQDWRSWNYADEQVMINLDYQ